MSNKQPHYNPPGAHKLQEVLYVLEAWGLRSSAYLWTACKYIARCVRSVRPFQDKIKARFYIEREIQMDMAAMLDDRAKALAQSISDTEQQQAKVLQEFAHLIRTSVRPSKVVHATIESVISSMPDKAHKRLRAAAPEDTALASWLGQELMKHPLGQWIKAADSE